jgi:signal transduction histidine kinase
MSWVSKIFAIFSLRRISGQIAALILVSLVLIHALIAGYFLVSAPKPKMFADEPIQQFELLARVLAQTSRSDRDLVLHNLDATFPSLQLRLMEGNAERFQRDQLRMTIPSSLDGRVELSRGLSSGLDHVWYHLPDGAVLEANVGSPGPPPFFGGLWAVTLLFLVLSVTLLGLWAGRALSSPLSAFARAAESFSLDQSPASIPETGPEEIRAAAKALNRMRERIGTLVNDRTRMLAAISHDLRTPITRLRLRCEYIDDEVQRAQSLRDLDQMQAMLESVLLLLRRGSARPPTLVDVATLLQTISDEFFDCGHTVIYRGPSRATFTVRPDEIRRAVTNLVDNAIRFGTKVTVRLDPADDRIIIEVSDNGPGIPDDRKDAMLEPFVRGDEARTLDATSGFGLGLSIAQSIAHAHDGTLSLHDNDPHGLVARLVLRRVGRAPV